jgi:DNA integrity scanning protein DisA with diadenylate cyclase activity
MVLVDFPPSIVHTLITFVVSHRIMQVAEDPASNQLVKPMWARLHRHLGIALPAINKLVSNEATRKGLATIVAVYTFLFATVLRN